jgi:hypothetical protein
MSISNYLFQQKARMRCAGSGLLTAAVGLALNGTIIAEDFCPKADLFQERLSISLQQ